VFVAGNVRSGSTTLVASPVRDGAIAVMVMAASEAEPQ
jgi:hypothetical protein